MFGERIFDACEQEAGLERIALHVLRRVRNWLVVERSVGLANADYEAAVRMRLDTALLPKPFQLSVLTGRDLQLESPWKRFIVKAAP